MNHEAEEGTRLVAEEPLLPVRMLNEFTYCPRLAYLEWVQGEFSDSADTVEGRFHHRRVDQGPSRPPAREAAPDDQRDDTEGAVIHQRSVWLSSERLGLTAKMDLVEGVGTAVAPVDYKRGKRPHVQQGAWEPERVQLCAQGLILRDNGLECDGGFLYFVGSRERVAVSFDRELI
jgi:CRISPR-associated protein Cas1